MESSQQSKEQYNPESILLVLKLNYLCLGKEKTPSPQPKESLRSLIIGPDASNNQVEGDPEEESPDIDTISRSKKYCKISNEQRMQLIDSVENNGEKIKQVGNVLPQQLHSMLGCQSS